MEVVLINIAIPQITATAQRSKSSSKSSPLTSPKKSHDKVASRKGRASDDVNLKLMRAIFYEYTKEIMPQRPVVVSMDLMLYKIKATVEKEGIFECVIALAIEWFDPRMSWNPREYGNISLLALDASTVWLPDIGMTNSADHPYQLTRDMRFLVRTNYKGEMRMVPCGTARTWCHLILWYFPFDVQTCSLEFETWSLDSSAMTFDGKSKVIIDSQFDSNQFYLCNYTSVTYFHSYDFYNETFTRVRFDLMVKRKSTFQVLNLIFPCAVLSCIQLLIFFLPSVRSTADRIGFATTNMLTLVVFQTFFAEELPRTSDAVTALSKYTTCLILIAAFGIVESVLVERMHDIRTQPPPRRLIWFLKKCPSVLREKSDTTILDIFEGQGDDVEKIAQSSKQASQQQTAINKGIIATTLSPKKLAEISAHNHNRNAKLWREVAIRTDFLSFVICFTLVILLPCGLFLPANFRNQTCGEIGEHN